MFRVATGSLTINLCRPAGSCGLKALRGCGKKACWNVVSHSPDRPFPLCFVEKSSYLSLRCTICLPSPTELLFYPPTTKMAAFCAPSPFANAFASMASNVRICKTCQVNDANPGFSLCEACYQRSQTMANGGGFGVGVGNGSFGGSYSGRGMGRGGGFGGGPARGSGRGSFGRGYSAAADPAPPAGLFTRIMGTCGFSSTANNNSGNLAMPPTQQRQQQQQQGCCVDCGMRASLPNASGKCFVCFQSSAGNANNHQSGRRTGGNGAMMGAAQRQQQQQQQATLCSRCGRNAANPGRSWCEHCFQASQQ